MIVNREWCFRRLLVHVDLSCRGISLVGYSPVSCSPRRDFPAGDDPDVYTAIEWRPTLAGCVPSGRLLFAESLRLQEVRSHDQRCIVSDQRPPSGCSHRFSRERFDRSPHSVKCDTLTVRRGYTDR